MRFSGKPGEDWIGHVDALETHRALKYSWTAKQFYYGLLHTLTDEAQKTAAAMEDDTEEMEMHRLLPDWFKPDMGEYRKMACGKVKYAELEPRSKVAIMLSYFEQLFQRDTAELAEE